MSVSRRMLVVRLSKRTIALVSAGALGVGGATIGWAATSGSDKSPPAALADALNKNEGTHLTEADIRQAMEDVFKARLDAAVKAGSSSRRRPTRCCSATRTARSRRAGRAPRTGQSGSRPWRRPLGMTAEEVLSGAEVGQDPGEARARRRACLGRSCSRRSRRGSRPRRRSTAAPFGRRARRHGGEDGRRHRSRCAGGHRGRGHRGFGPGFAPGFGPGEVPPLGP